jgi:putative transposase
MRERHGFLLVGYVVMPEHVHPLIGEPAQCTPSIMLAALKQRVSRDLRAHGGGKGLPRFWQHRFYDFNVHSATKRREKLDYMHLNPVKRELVKDPSAWIWSSASFHASGVPGLVPIDPVP